MIAWSAWVAFALFFSAVYNHYGHGVRSAYMNLLFIWPLSGTLAAAITRLVHFCPALTARRLFRAAAATMAAGFLLKGITEIAGASSAYLPVYFIAGTVLYAAAAAVCLKKKPAH